MKLKFKIILGFREDQFITVDEDEVHQAYYLFLNPDKRAVFSNGLAVIGQDIRQIVPDYNATMGWYQSHKLDSYDWAELRSKGVDRKLQDVLVSAKQLAETGRMELLAQPLQEAIKQLNG